MSLVWKCCLTLFAGFAVASCFADSVEAIRAEWQQAQSYQPLASGERLFVAPDHYSSSDNAAHPPNPATATTFMGLASRAAELGEAALAVRLATQALHHDPDCEPARRALGYQRHGGRWLTPYAARMSQRGLEWSGTYGWIDADDLPRLEAGQRKIGSRWVSGEFDAHRHDTIERGWQVRTDHFNVTTNHSLEAGVRLAAKLEQLYQVWQQLFADFYIDDQQLRERFADGKVPGPRSRPFQVVYHRDQAQYNSKLLARQPRIAETVGVYFDRQREAHFFYPKGDASTPGVANDATLYHESVHQLFQESGRARRDAGLHDNFWVIEGVATWFESLRRRESESGVVYYTIGEADAGRLPLARQRWLVDGYRVPLAELVTLGKLDLQRRSDLAPLYSQAAGLAAFFMADDQRHASFVEYLQQVYQGRSEPSTLASLAGTTYPALDAEYEAFLRELPQ